MLDHVVKYINTAVPESARAEVLTSITKCVKEHGKVLQSFRSNLRSEL